MPSDNFLNIRTAFCVMYEMINVVETYRHKKRSTAVLQPLLTLKSNTMKNTLQRYGFFCNCQVFGV